MAIDLKKYILRVLKWFFVVAGAGFVLMVVLSFTDYPYWAYHWLGTTNAEMNDSPDYIVVMGAGGMPSPDGLMRCYYAAGAAKEYPEAEVIVALPTKEEYFYESYTYDMFEEIRDRGIDSTRFRFEIDGVNTRTQAVEISKMIPGKDTASLMVITSPVHVYRSVKAFENVGFADVGGLASFERAVSEKDLEYSKKRKEDKEALPGNLDLRYNMWNYLKYEITILREVFAITYYEMRGWI
ncbi:MAG: YdcF family protein [Bacteroidales bacterium]|nr:YdcF family protein [Bacteroidales bacterium]MCF8332996.1 YdcF family protein [Bacteroidales bacterium]